MGLNIRKIGIIIIILILATIGSIESSYYTISEEGDTFVIKNEQTGQLEKSAKLNPFFTKLGGETKRIVLQGDFDIKETILIQSNTRIEFRNTKITYSSSPLFKIDNAKNILFSGKLNVVGGTTLLSESYAEDLKWIADTQIAGNFGNNDVFIGWQGSKIEIANIKTNSFKASLISLNGGNKVNIHDVKIKLAGTIDRIPIHLYSNRADVIEDWIIKNIEIDGSKSDETISAIAIEGNRGRNKGSNVIISNITVTNYNFDGLDVIDLYNTQIDRFKSINGGVGGLFICSDKTTVTNSMVEGNSGVGYAFGDPVCKQFSYSDLRIIDSIAKNNIIGIVTTPAEGTGVSEVLIDNFRAYDNRVPKKQVYGIALGLPKWWGYKLGKVENVSIINTNVMGNIDPDGYYIDVTANNIKIVYPIESETENVVTKIINFVTKIIN